VSSAPAWLTVDDVAKYLDLPASSVTDDDNLSLSTATVKAAVERRRSDLALTLDGAIAPADVHGGAVMWAALVYQTRNAPSGFAGYGDETMLFDSLGARRAEVMRLVGWRRPVAT
jgi:hypothetical protein